jgi:hypothetical protein
VVRARRSRGNANSRQYISSCVHNLTSPLPQPATLPSHTAQLLHRQYVTESRYAIPGSSRRSLWTEQSSTASAWSSAARQPKPAFCPRAPRPIRRLKTKPAFCLRGPRPTERNSKNASVAVRPLVLKTEVDQLDIGSERHRVASKCKSSFLLRQPNRNSEGLLLSNLGFASSVISLVGDGVDPNNEETDSVDRS